MLGNGGVHVPELAAVALVKDDDHVLLKHRVPGILPDEDRQLLNGGHQNAGLGIFQLPLEDGGVGIAVGRPLFKTVILLHGLVVQVLAVHHEENLVDVWQLAGQLSRLEGGQGFAAARGVPDVSPCLQGSPLLVLGGDLDAVQDPLGGGDLVGAHHQQQFLRGEHAVAGEEVEQGVLGEKGLGEVHQVRNHLVVPIRPEGGELKAVAGLLPLAFVLGGLFDVAVAGGVGVVLGVGAVGDHKDLHILIQPAGAPEAVPLVALDLVERLPDGHPPALKLHVDQGQAVDQNGHVIPGAVAAPFLLVLVDHLEAVVVDVLLV